MQEKSEKRFGRVFIGDSVYALYLYLLYSSEAEIEDTFFFVGYRIDPSIKNKLKNKYEFTKETDNAVLSRFNRIRLRYQSRKKWSFLKDAQLFAQDHLFFSHALIGDRNYTLIEDAPNVFTDHRKRLNHRKPSSVFTYIKKNILRSIFGNSLGGEMGDNPYCQSVLITKLDSDPVLENKELIQINEQELWNNASESKKHTILAVYNITTNDLFQLKKRNIILFTQNFVTLGYISEEELIDIYLERLKKYPLDQVVIKNHPSDKVGYITYFPEAYVFSKPIPMQLLSVLGVKYRTAITICSSVVLSFDYDITIDWIGTKVNKKLLAVLGEQKLN